MMRCPSPAVRRLPIVAQFGLVLLVVACASGPSQPPDMGPDPAEATNPLLAPESPEMNRPAPDTFKVLFETTAGDFIVEAVSEWAPLGTQRFFNLVEAGYYDGVRFFRVIPDFVAQFGIHGDPEVARAWQNARIPDDSVRVSNDRGTITFATAGPNTRTVQLFINLVDNGRLDTSGFSPFGRITGGMDTVDRIYGGYGEGAPRGDGPPQSRIQEEGEPYLEQAFPRLDQVIRARVIGLE